MIGLAWIERLWGLNSCWNFRRSGEERRKRNLSKSWILWFFQWKMKLEFKKALVPICIFYFSLFFSFNLVFPYFTLQLRTLGLSLDDAALIGGWLPFALCPWVFSVTQASQIHSKFWHYQNCVWNLLGHPLGTMCTVQFRMWIWNKTETFEDALFESGKTSTHKTNKFSFIQYH